MKKIFAIGVLALMGGCSTPTHTQLPVPEEKAVVHPARVEHMVFFEWDSVELPENINEILAPHVNYLLNHPHSRLLIEGSSDETGDEQYNIDLGLRRAKSVKQAFLALGIAESQLITRSRGIQRPLHHQNTQVGMARNRRVTLFY